MLALRRAWLFASVVCLGLTVACGGGSSTSGSGSGGSGGSSGGSGSSSGPTITNFSSTPSVTASGQVVNFAWTTTNATAFAVTPSILGEDQTSLPLNSNQYPTVAPTSTTTYTAQATGASGTTPATASTTVTVVPMTLTASATTIEAGQSVNLTYSGPNNGSAYVLNTCRPTPPRH